MSSFLDFLIIIAILVNFVISKEVYLRRRNKLLRTSKEHILETIYGETECLGACMFHNYCVAFNTYKENGRKKCDLLDTLEGELIEKDGNSFFFLKSAKNSISTSPITSNNANRLKYIDEEDKCLVIANFILGKCNVEQYQIIYEN